jgi:hypothetical protein
MGCAVPDLFAPGNCYGHRDLLQSAMTPLARKQARFESQPVMHSRDSEGKTRKGR